MTTLSKPAGFFDYLRGNALLGPVLTASEVQGLTAILDAAGRANWPISFTAYALATAYRETGTTMLPIKEYGGNTYLRRMYDIEGARPQLARANGNVSPGDGVRYCGRGLVQLTWRNNYRKLGLRVGKDLENYPDLALDPGIASDIMVAGMAEGLFAGPKLSGHLPGSGLASRDQFRASRPIINGHDHDDDIAGFALQFQSALVGGGWQ